jgi:hypothetical protein
MKFPGSKLLRQWDLSVRHLSLEDLLRSCQQAGLTGLAEIKFPQGVGLIFYYLEAEVNALYREGGVGQNGSVALDELRAKVRGKAGFISVYELPLDMAHMLRGIANRRRLKQTLRARADLIELLHQLEKTEHTGTLEIETRTGAAMVLLVRGRASNTYWESREGLTLERGEARQRLEQALDDGDETSLSSPSSRATSGSPATRSGGRPRGVDSIAGTSRGRPPTRSRPTKQPCARGSWTSFLPRCPPSSRLSSLTS